MTFGIVIISLTEIDLHMRTPTEQLLAITLFENPWGLKKSVTWTCFVDVWSDCRKDSIFALGPVTTVLGFDFGFLEVESSFLSAQCLYHSSVTQLVSQ